MAIFNSTIPQQDSQASRLFAVASKHYFTSPRDVSQDDAARRIFERAEQLYRVALSEQPEK